MQLPALGTPSAGIFVTLCGLVLTGLGVTSLRGASFDHGSPLPSPLLVTNGVYRWLPHPMYTGFTLTVLGLAMFFQSPGALWLAVPATALGSAALVFGYERPALERRFGAAAHEYRWLPPDSDKSPAGMARIRCYLFVLLPWVFCYEVIVWSGRPKGAFALPLPGESNWPILAWTEPIYMSTYVIVALTPLLARTSRDLRQFMLRAWIGMGVAFSLYLAIPVIAPLKDFTPHGFWGAALAYERRADPPLAAFPSFHTIWAFLTAALLARRGRKLAPLWWLWAIAVAVSCVATGQHWTADVAAGIAFSLALIRIDRMWLHLRNGAERVANSWRESHLGPVRVVHHGVYGGLAVALTTAMVGSLIGPGHEVALLAAIVCGLGGAMLWSHRREGWARLPCGYYGGFLAVALACAAAPLFGIDWLIMLAACSLAAPWMQAIGRLRCLVEGCCHGRPAAGDIGICYRNPKSRVVRVAALQGRPLHPTPLYSMLWNAFTAVVLARMWWTACDLHLIAGVFLMLNGMGRFVEEAYRGEQPRIIAGLRSHQWIAALTTVAGGILTTLGVPTPAPAPTITPGTLLIAAAVGVIASLAFTVDFPAEEQQMARAA